MALGYARKLKSDLFDACSAGVAPREVDPRAVRVMAEDEVDLVERRSVSLAGLAESDLPFDVVFTLGERADDLAIARTGGPSVEHHPFLDAVGRAENSSDEEALDIFRRLRDEIRVWIECFERRPDGVGVRQYPVFVDPDRYMKLRRGQSGVSLHNQVELWALRRLLRGVAVDRGLLDVPCGPGRLFPMWKALKLPILGVDYSKDFVVHARAMLTEMQYPGKVMQWDAFRLDQLDEVRNDPPSLIACVRFIYYFDGPKRLELLRKLAGLGAPHLLIQYLVSDSLLGRRRAFADRRRGDSRRAHRGGHIRKDRMPHRTVLAELEAAGLRVLRSVGASPGSERVYYLCEPGLPPAATS
jgi:arsenate reductase